MTKARTVRLIEIAELLGVIHQRTSVIVRPAGLPRPGRPRGQIRLWDPSPWAHLARSGLNEPNGPDWKIALWSEPLLAQASADLAKRLALESAMRLGGEKLSPEEA